MKPSIPALALLAVSVLNASDSVERLSVSVTPGGSVRLLQIDKNGFPTLLDKSVGEQQWNKAPDPEHTVLPQNTAILGLPNAEVRAFGFEPDGLAEYRATRTADTWTRAVIDARPGVGQPCTLRAGRSSYVFAKSAAGGLIAKREQGVDWGTLSAVEAAVQGSEISAAGCGAVTGNQIAIVATTGSGTRLVMWDNSNDQTRTSELTDAKGQAVILAGHPAVTSSTKSADIAGVTTSGTLAHWTRAPGATAWRFETISTAAAPSGSPSAAYFQKQLFLSTLRVDGTVAVYRHAPDGPWEESALNAPAGDAFQSDPQLAVQPDQMSMFAVLASGKAATLKYSNSGWTSDSVAEATTQVMAGGNLKALATTIQPTLTQFIDSIPLLIPPAPEVVTTNTTTISTQNGVSFQNLTQTTSRSANLSEVITSDPNSDLIWPGSIIQGSTVSSGLLAGVGVARAPLTITINGAAGTGPLSTTIPTPTLSTVATGIRNLLQNLNLVNGTAFIDYDIKTGNSEEDALLNLGVSANFLGQNVKASLNSSSTQKSNTVVVKLAQRYYTLAVDTPSSPATVFAPGVSVSDATRFMGAGNPPVYLSEVTYGRELVYLFESSDSIDKLQATVDAVFKIAQAGGSVSLTDDQMSTFSNSHIHMFALGGSATDALNLVVAKDFATQLNTYLVQGANFSFNSPGTPLSYTVKYLKDGSVMQINSATQWYTTQSFALPASGTFYIGLGSQHRDCSAQYQSGTIQTGLYVRPGDQFSIQASGQIWSGVFATGFNPPNGWYTWKTPTKGIGFPNEKVSPFSLLYQIGGNANQYVGYGLPSQVYNGSTGQLELLINTNNYSQGSGCFQVNVTVNRQN